MVKRFLLYGLVGICAEIFWTGMSSLIQGDIRLRGFTYIWMFPIYGLIVFLEPVQHKIKKWPLVLRGCVYTIIIFVAEYISGSLLKSVLGVCPWNYTGPLSVNGLIRFDFAPIWFCFGIIIEIIHSKIDKVSILLRTQG